MPVVLLFFHLNGSLGYLFYFEINITHTKDQFAVLTVMFLKLNLIHFLLQFSCLLFSDNKSVLTDIAPRAICQRVLKFVGKVETRNSTLEYHRMYQRNLCVRAYKYIFLFSFKIVKLKRKRKEVNANDRQRRRRQKEQKISCTILFFDFCL